MIPYKDISGDSGIAAYTVGDDYIKVQFADGEIYLYNYNTNGKNNIEEMKVLASKGKGLATFINKYIRENFAAKLT